MHLLLAPWRVRPDPLLVAVRAPDIPVAWSYEQATSRFDTGARTGRPLRSCVVVDQPQAAIDAFLAAAPDAVAHALHRDVATVRASARTSATARAEYRAAVRERVAPLIAEEDDRDQTETLVRSVLPFLMAAGLHVLARAVLGGDAGAIAWAAVIMSDAFTAADNTEIHARAATGGTWYVVGAGTNRVKITSNRTNWGGTGSWSLMADDGSAIGDQYSQATPVVANNAHGPAVRCSSTASRCYWMTCESGSTRVFRTTSGTSFGTQIASAGSGHTLGEAARLEIVGDDIEAFADTSTLEASVTDSTAGFETGTGGIMHYVSGGFDDFEWGDFGSSGETGETSDEADAADAVTTLRARTAAAADTADASDAAAGLRARLASSADAGAGGFALSMVRHRKASTTDGAAAVDATSGLRARLAQTSDGAGTGDAGAALRARLASTTDAATASDEVTAQVFTGASTSDAGAVGFAVSMVRHRRASIADGSAAVDALSTLRARLATASFGALPGGSVATLRARLAAITETANGSDTATATGDILTAARAGLIRHEGATVIRLEGALVVVEGGP